MNQLDPVNVAVLAVAALIGSTELAQIIGPYAVICIMASIGAALSVGGTKGLNTLQALGYFVLVVLIAITFTYYLTQLCIVVFGPWLQFKGDIPPTWLMGVVAFVVGCIGTNWRSVPKWITSSVKEKIQSLGNKQ